MAIRFSEATIGKEENGHEKNESRCIYLCIYLSRFNDSISYLYAGGGSMRSMTALGTSLALPLFNMESAYHEPVRGFKILILLAVCVNA